MPMLQKPANTRFPAGFGVHQARYKTKRPSFGSSIFFDNEDEALEVVRSSFNDSHVQSALRWLIVEEKPIFVPLLMDEVVPSIPTARRTIFSLLHRKARLMRRVWRTEAEAIKTIKVEDLSHIDEITLNQLAACLMRFCEHTLTKDQQISHALYSTAFEILKLITVLPTDVEHSIQINPEVLLMYRIPDAPLIAHFKPQTPAEWLAYLVRIARGMTDMPSYPFSMPSLSCNFSDDTTRQYFERAKLAAAACKLVIDRVIEAEASQTILSTLYRMINDFFLKDLARVTEKVRRTKNLKKFLNEVRGLFDHIVRLLVAMKHKVNNPLIRVALFNRSLRVLGDNTSDIEVSFFHLMHLRHRGEDILLVYKHYFAELRNQVKNGDYAPLTFFSGTREAFELIANIMAEIDFKSLPVLREALESHGGSVEAIKLAVFARNLELRHGRYSFQDIAEDSIQQNYSDRLLEISMRSANKTTFHDCPTDVLRFDGQLENPSWEMLDFGYNERVGRYVDEYVEANKRSGYQDASRFFCYYQPTKTTTISIGGKKEVVPKNFALMYNSRIMDVRNLLRALRSTLCAGVTTADLLEAWLRAFSLVVSRAIQQKDIATLLSFMVRHRLTAYPSTCANFDGMITAQQKASASILRDYQLIANVFANGQKDQCTHTLDTLMSLFPIYFARHDVRENLLGDLRNAFSETEKTTRKIHLVLLELSSLMMGTNRYTEVKKLDLCKFSDRLSKIRFVGQKTPTAMISSIIKSDYVSKDSILSPLISTSNQLTLYYLNKSSLKSESAFTMAYPLLTYMFEIVKDELFAENTVSTHSIAISTYSMGHSTLPREAVSDSSYAVLFLRHMCLLWFLRRVFEHVEEKMEQKEKNESEILSVSTNNKTIFNLSEVSAVVSEIINFWAKGMSGYSKITGPREIPQLVACAGDLLLNCLKIGFESLAAFNDRFTVEESSVERPISLISRLAAGVARDDLSRVPIIATAMSCAKPLSRESYNWVQSIMRNIPRREVGNVFIHTLEQLMSQKFSSLTSTRCIIESLFDASNRLVDAKTVLTALCSALGNPSHAHIAVLLWEETISRIIEFASDASDKDVKRIVDKLPTIRKAFDFETLLRFVGILQPWVNSSTKGLLNNKQTLVVNLIMEKVFGTLLRPDFLGTNAFTLYRHPVFVEQKRFQTMLGAVLPGVLKRSNILVPHVDEAICFSALFNKDFNKVIREWADRSRTTLQNSIALWREGSKKHVFKPNQTQEGTLKEFCVLHQRFVEEIQRGFMVAVSYIHSHSFEGLDNLDRFNMDIQLDGISLGLDELYKRVKEAINVISENLVWLVAQPIRTEYRAILPVMEILDVVYNSAHCIPANCDVVEYHMALLSNHSDVDDRRRTVYGGLYKAAIALPCSISTRVDTSVPFDITKYEIKNFSLFSGLLRDITSSESPALMYIYKAINE